MTVEYVPIMEERRPAPALNEVNCAGCDHLGNFNDEHKSGYCMLRRRMVSTWHPARCTGFVQIARERRVKVPWKGVSYG